MALPQVLDSQVFPDFYTTPMHDKNCMWYFYENKKRREREREWLCPRDFARPGTDTRSSNSLVRSRREDEGKDIKSKAFQVARRLASTPGFYPWSMTMDSA